MILTLIRHPPVDAAQRCYGRLDLLPTADALAHAVQHLSSHNTSCDNHHDRQNSHWISSPAQRCVLLAQQLTSSVEINPLWQELDFGQWEGLRWDDIPRHALDDWAADIWHYRVGQTGETAAELNQRLQHALAQLTHHRHVTVVTHAGVIRMLLAQHGLIADNDRWSAPIAYATPYTLER